MDTRQTQQPATPLLVIIVIAVAVVTLLWMGVNWMGETSFAKVQSAPFLQVTNREISLFLWQNPEYMRINRAVKTGYLPAFRSKNGISPLLEEVEKPVAAPPELLFLYHHWKRLLGQTVIERPITREQFTKFLDFAPEWQPGNWPSAPRDYAPFVRDVADFKLDITAPFPYTLLPNPVRIALLGWLNYLSDLEKINQMQVSVQSAQRFLEQYPQYRRHYWRNLYPGYLKSLLDPHLDPQAFIPRDDLPPFLRVAIYNWTLTPGS